MGFSTKCEDGNQASGLKLLPISDLEADSPLDEQKRFSNQSDRHLYGLAKYNELKWRLWSLH